MSGAGVSLLLNFQVNTAIYKDYYYKSIYEPVTGKGLYMPYYTLLRTFNYTKSMIDDNFKPLIQAR